MSENAEVTAPRLWIVLARAYGAIASYVERSLSAQGVGLSDFMVLEALLHKGPLTISAIGEKVLLASASMTSAIDRLEKHGFVLRKSCDTDRRIRFVELTAEGRRFISELYGQHVEELESLTKELSAAERNSLYAGLKKLGLAAKAATPADKKQIG